MIFQPFISLFPLQICMDPVINWAPVPSESWWKRGRCGQPAQILMISKDHQLGSSTAGEEVSLGCRLRAEVHLSSHNLSWCLLCQSFTQHAVKLYDRLMQRRLFSPCCSLPIEDIIFPGAICLSTLPYQETINTTICGLVTSPVIPPNQIMTNWKKQGE